MGKFFSIDVIPDIINGDVSNVQDSDTGFLDIGANDILFDWTAVDVPKGANKLVSISAFANYENGSYHTSHNTDIILWFAKSFNGVAPATLGAVNTAPDGCFNMRSHFIGGYVLKATEQHQIPRFQDNWGWNYVSGGSLSYGGNTDATSFYGAGLPMVMDLDHISGTNVGYDSLYVAGIQVSARAWHTGVIVNGAITSDTEDTITVDGVDANKQFSIGDTVYLHDVDTALGTVKSIAANGLSITLNAPIAGGTDLADDDHLLNANPIRMKFGFER